MPRLFLTLVVFGALAFVIIALGRTPAPDEEQAQPEARQAAAAERAAPHGSDAAAAHHTVVLPDQIEWKDGPPSLPPGAKFVVLEGDPAKPGLFAIRTKLPDGYTVPPHFHPGVERLTVLSGTFRLGTGDRFDRAAARALPAGSYTSMPPA